MDPRFLKYYEQELQHVRETCAQFAADYPKIAARLGIEAFECLDPYVERLLEGFAYMAARVQLKVDAEFPHFTQSLLEIVYPHFRAPTPSMCMVQFQPNVMEGSLADGFSIPRNTVLRSRMGQGYQTPCEFRTSHDVTLWPLELFEARYLGSTAAVGALGIPDLKGVKSGVRLRLRTTADLSFDDLALDKLVLLLRGSGDVAMNLYEQFIGNAVSVVLQPDEKPAPWRTVNLKGTIRQLGFSPEESLIPYGARSFQGYRLLQEFFAFPDRFMLVEIGALQSALRQSHSPTFDVIVLFDKNSPSLEDNVDAANFSLFCTPAINLFPKRADRIHLAGKTAEFHVVPDRSRPIDFEIHSIQTVHGYGAGPEPQQEFLPFYSLSDASVQTQERAFYTVRREPRAWSSRQRTQGPRSSYVGSEVYVSLVDANETPYRSENRQLGLTTLCTNRDLPLHMNAGTGRTDFTLEVSAPIDAARCVSGPTTPKPSRATREKAWQLISHLSLNYLSITDGGNGRGTAAIRDLLELYVAQDEQFVRKQIEGLVSISSKPINRRLLAPGVISFGRGLEVEITLDEALFEGTGVFLIGAVLERFFAHYASINSFTETVVKTQQRGEIMRWPTRIGQRHLI